MSALGVKTAFHPGGVGEATSNNMHSSHQTHTSSSPRDNVISLVSHVSMLEEELKEALEQPHGINL